MTLIETSCYMCENIAISDEHTPPKCIFPEIKDLNIDYRKSLITVPSCDIHNLKKSKDDEYLMMVLTCNIVNNDVAMKQLSTKIIRSWERNPNLSKLLLQNTKSVRVGDEATIAFQVDISRFKKSIDWIARGIYYNQYKRKWLTKLDIESPALLFMESHNIYKNTIMNQMVAMINKVFQDIDKIGENPDVFWYQILHEKPNELLINMMFFNGVQIIASAKNN